MAEAQILVAASATRPGLLQAVDTGRLDLAGPNPTGAFARADNHLTVNRLLFVCFPVLVALPIMIGIGPLSGLGAAEFVPGVVVISLAMLGGRAVRWKRLIARTGQPPRWFR